MLRVYNTARREKQDFIPREAGKVGMYVCGVTPYNYCHLGHARAYVTFDVIKRYLEYIGYEVKHVQNFTDIDDKLIKQANAEGTTIFAVADKYINAYFEDMDALNIKRAQIYPRVTKHLPEIINVIEGLIKNGYAYQVDNDVYFDISKFKGYGKLSGRSLEEMKAGARIEIDERKRHPMDFALWKGAKAGEPAWESPWGMGRPGWHIECSALSLKYLGNSFDIHGGGADLIFPHHENEIAQSEAFTGEEPFARYWIHNGFVTINEEKMSKSLGNFFTIRDILKKYSPMGLRFFLLSTHYRSPIDFTPEKIEEAERALQRLVGSRENLQAILKAKQGKMLEKDNGQDASFAQKIVEAREKFREAMDDDFNTALAIGVLFDFARETNIFVNSLGEGLSAREYALLQEADNLFAEWDSVLGIFPKPKEGAVEGLAENLLTLLLEVRQDARAQKNWAISDKIRDGLREFGVIIEDTPQGPRWKFADK